MPYKHPYTLGSTGLIQVIQQLQKAFPPTITAETLKKLGIAPNNESYLINTLKFIGIIDDEGNKFKEAAGAFLKPDNAEFAQEFSKLVRSAYSELFALHSDDSWTLEQGKLISFFRGSDESSAEVGRRQAITFQALAALSGYSEIRASSKTQNAKTTAKKTPQISARPQVKKITPAVSTPKFEQNAPASVERKARDLGLTVRIEINLPAVADQATYDMIFKSIRENLIDVE
jgi:hypothetical protein